MSSAPADFATFATFDTAAYLRDSYLHPRQPSTTFCVDMRRFLMHAIHDFYASLPSPPSPRATILEFGGGPVIAYLISAAPHAARIVFSDHCPSARRAVSDWLVAAPAAHDWRPFFAFVLEDLEHDHSPDAPARRENDLRAKIDTVLHCDANLEHPIGPGYEHHFDVVSISFCFESACKSHDDVVRTLRSIARMMKPGAWLRANGVRGGSYYHVHGQRFFNLTQTEHTLRDSLAKAGFVNVTVQTFDNVHPPPKADYDGVYHVAAQLA